MEHANGWVPHRDAAVTLAKFLVETVITKNFPREYTNFFNVALDAGF